MHNKQLADERGVSEEDREYIDQLHDLLYKLINSYTLDVPYEEAEALVKSANKTLSDLWGFDYNPRYDQWTPRLAQKWMKLAWEGKRYRCKDTGAEVLLTCDKVYEKSFVRVGNGFVDLGVANGYSRFGGNIEEII